MNLKKEVEDKFEFGNSKNNVENRKFVSSNFSTFERLHFAAWQAIKIHS